MSFADELRTAVQNYHNTRYEELSDKEYDVFVEIIKKMCRKTADQGNDMLVIEEGDCLFRMDENSPRKCVVWKKVVQKLVAQGLKYQPPIEYNGIVIGHTFSW